MHQFSISTTKISGFAYKKRINMIFFFLSIIQGLGKYVSFHFKIIIIIKKGNWFILCQDGTDLKHIVPRKLYLKYSLNYCLHREIEDT